MSASTVYQMPTDRAIERAIDRTIDRTIAGGCTIGAAALESDGVLGDSTGHGRVYCDV